MDSKFSRDISGDAYALWMSSPDIVGEYMAERLKDYDCVIEICCAIGVLSCNLAKKISKVVGIDIDAQRIDMAKQNAKIYEVSNNTSFICGSGLDEELLQHIASNNQGKKLLCIIDPDWEDVNAKGKLAKDIDSTQPSTRKLYEAVSRNITSNIMMRIPRTFTKETLDNLTSKHYIENIYIDGVKRFSLAFFVGEVLETKDIFLENPGILTSKYTFDNEAKTSDPLLVIGLQFGDEGKGKMIDYLSDKYDCTIRHNGANNAGHTVKYGDITLPLSHLPSSILRNKKVYIAQGCCINPQTLKNEIERFEQTKQPLKLAVDSRCHIIFPYHQILDYLSEKSRGENAIGSLHLGVGFSYADKTNRHGLRMSDLVNVDTFEEKFREFETRMNKEIKKQGHHTCDLLLNILEKYEEYRQPLIDAIGTETHSMKCKGRCYNISKVVCNKYIEYGNFLRRFIKDVAEDVICNLDKRTYLLESAQSFYLDYGLGTYPYTVAYHTNASSALSNIGLPPMRLNVLGIARCYMIRVGNGPFPTELCDNDGNDLRQLGNEFGTVSKRPRRCGWLDIPLLLYAIRMNGVKEIALTKLDVLSHMKKLKVCTGYHLNGRPLQNWKTSDLGNVTPIYRDFHTWSSDISNCRTYDELPQECKTYISFIEKSLEVFVRYVSVGAERDQTIIRKTDIIY
jgi:adenylosuccinate synthase